ncbi:LysR family transcriptional regulator [Erythrobacter mangrovi]|uniref:LysR family transcriptional regulator n=1 Tax=Erythrobacter mangrovi TaxID=2739433 RepID=A0A7D3XA56_9SPHN|nr:LysR family transcriptional regulator [Erythrobacter mangrovi]QKG70570.1 LysR family transcriptional regulator [Erythrobacter mangrovi]
MKDWDDLRYFLAVARSGSIRAAASDLAVNSSTVSRRIASFEARANQLLFDRSAAGYELTEAGLQIFESVERIEQEANAVGRQLLGRDSDLKGPLKITMPNTIATRLIMPDLVQFADTYPEIELAIDVSMSMADLVRRQADVAIRVSNDPPGHLFGRRLVKYARSIYASHGYLARVGDHKDASRHQWIGWEDKVVRPQWVRESPHPETAIKHRIPNTLAHLEAARNGLGLCMLPCFIGDTEPTLARVDAAFSEPDRDIWILTHEDLRHTARVRRFMEFAAKAILSKKDLLEGRRAASESSIADHTGR